MSYASIKLPDDPKEALRHIASYLRTARTDRSRTHVEGSDVVGYYQCTEWLNGLQEIASECDRIAK